MSLNAAGSRKQRLVLTADKLQVFAGEKQILHDVSSEARSANLMAIMGPSGSGKTTFLNSLAGRMPLRCGSVSLNGVEVSQRMRKLFGYVTQMDVFFPILTLRQTVEFAARVKLPDSMSEKERKDRIAEVVRSLELEKCLDTLMGSIIMPGLSGGEKKRANIACELLRNPDVLLLDEPTSGLDASLALTIIHLLRHWAAEENKIVVMSIHQPSSQIFHIFDDLMLLTDGHVSYFGKEHNMVNYFESIGVPFRKHWNPADYMLEIVKQSSDVKELIIGKGAVFSDLGTIRRTATTADVPSLEQQQQEEPQQDERQSDEEQRRDEEGEEQERQQHGKEQQQEEEEEQQEGGEEQPQENAKRHGDGEAVELGHVNPAFADEAAAASNSSGLPQLSEARQVSWGRQLQALTIRGLHLSRTRFLSLFPIIQMAYIGLLSSLLWFQIARKEERISDLIGCVFFLVIHLSFLPLMESIMSFHEDINIVRHERRAGMYQIGAYYVSKLLTEMPLVIVVPFVALTIIYWTAGLAGGAFYLPFVLGILFNAMACQGIGVFIGLLTDKPSVNLTAAFIFMMFSLLLGGFFTTAIPPWLNWAKWLSFIRYCYHFCLLLVLQDSPQFQCATTVSSKYPSCSAAGTNGTRYFPAQEIVDNFRDEFLPVWANFLMILVFLLVFRIAGYLWLRFMKKA